MERVEEKRKHVNDLRRKNNLKKGFSLEIKPDYIFVRADGEYVRINFSALICVQAKRGYSLVVTEMESYIILNNLHQLIELLPKNLFCRIHHSFIVAVSRIRSFDNENVYLYGQPEGKEFKPGLACVTQLPIGAFYRKNIKDSIWFLPSYTGRRSKEIKEAEYMLHNENSGEEVEMPKIKVRKLKKAS